LQFGKISGKLVLAACAIGSRPLGRGPKRFYAGTLRRFGIRLGQAKKNRISNDLLGRGILRA
jgi:hypothetical protein